MSQAGQEMPERVESISRLFAELSRALVDYPDEVSVAVTPEPGRSVLHLRVDPRDIGKLIGKQGRTARSLRTILSAMSMRLNYQFSLDIVELDDIQNQS